MLAYFQRRPEIRERICMPSAVRDFQRLFRLGECEQGATTNVLICPQAPLRELFVSDLVLSGFPVGWYDFSLTDAGRVYLPYPVAYEPEERILLLDGLDRIALRGDREELINVAEDEGRHVLIGVASIQAIPRLGIALGGSRTLKIDTPSRPIGSSSDETR